MSNIMKINYLLNLEEHFIGFDIDDKVLIIFKNKKKLLKMELSKETGEPMEVEEPTDSPSNVHKNHVNKKKQSKSNKLTTPTFNLTSSYTRMRHRTVRKNISDISDAIFKIPFEHGWKRELVYRTSGESAALNGAHKKADVYYHSPNNQKLRSLREIQELLNILSDKSVLTIDCFTFVRKPIGVNDRSKELIRDARFISFKENTSVGAVQSKKSKTPTQRPSFDFKNKKSASKTKKNSKTSLRSRSKKGNSEKILRDIQSIALKKMYPKLEIVDFMKNGLPTSDWKIMMQTRCGKRCPYIDVPCSLICTRCQVHYHTDCVEVNVHLKTVSYICLHCGIILKERDTDVQSSHTLVVGATESEKPLVELIRTRQVHQAPSTPISKIEEPHYKIDEYRDGNVSKTKMVDGSFYEQYVYEMKQKRGSSLMTIVIQEPKNLEENSEMNGSFKEMSTTFASMQTLNYMVKALGHVFKYLNTRELVSASRVCTAWNIIAMNKLLWQNCRLKNAMVYDWERFVDSIDQQRTDTLDTRRMSIPVQNDEFKNFWLHFSKAIKRAQNLKFIELYKCPTHVVEDIIHSLPQLEVLNATSIKNPNVTKETKNPHDLMALNLNYLGQMTNLTELRLKGLTGIKLTSLPSFENLINLNKFSLTSINSFPKDICQSLDTITDNIEFLEIGDCDVLSKDFAVSLKRFVNLKSLRLENCYGKWESYVQDVFTAIRGLEKLTILELVNIEFSNCVEDELEKCVGIKALLIIPTYMSKSAITNCHLIDCLEKLSKTLTHLVWGLTRELLFATDLFITQYQQNQHSIACNLVISHTNEKTNHIPILRTRKPRQRPEEESAPENDKNKDKLDEINLLSVTDLEKLLDTMMPDAKTRVIKVPFSRTVRVYLSEQFNYL